jgi:hypothetical protein
MIKYIVLLILLFPTRLNAQWRLGLTLASDALIYEDCAQTHYALHHGGWEGNPILGPHPSDWTLASSCIASGIVNTFAPRQIRPFVNGLTILVESFVVARNYTRYPTDRSSVRVGLRLWL